MCRNLSLTVLAGPILLIASALLTAARDQPAAPVTIATQSHSGQFIIRAAASLSPSAFTRALATDSSLVRLDPMLLTVSCERIKQNLWPLRAGNGAGIVA